MPSSLVSPRVSAKVVKVAKVAKPTKAIKAPPKPAKPAKVAKPAKSAKVAKPSKPIKAPPKPAKTAARATPTRSEVRAGQQRTHALLLRPTMAALRPSSGGPRVSKHFPGVAGVAGGAVALATVAWIVVARARSVYAGEALPVRAPKEAAVALPAPTPLPAPAPEVATMPRVVFPASYDRPEFRRPVTGTLVGAVEANRLDPLAWTWVPIPGYDLEVEVPCDAFRCSLVGVDHMRVGVNYLELRSLCKALACVPPSKSIVEAIYTAAVVRPKPKFDWVQTKADADAMNTAAQAFRYNAYLEGEIAKQAKVKGLEAFPTNTLIDPVGKWWILHPNLTTSKWKEHAAITYGWFDGSLAKPQQGVSLDSHNDEHSDYSQLGRAVRRMARTASSKAPVDLCDWYVEQFKLDAMKPFIDVFR